MFLILPSDSRQFFSVYSGNLYNYPCRKARDMLHKNQSKTKQNKKSSVFFKTLNNSFKNIRFPFSQEDFSFIDFNNIAEINSEIFKNMVDWYWYLRQLLYTQWRCFVIVDTSGAECNLQQSMQCTIDEH